MIQYGVVKGHGGTWCPSGRHAAVPGGQQGPARVRCGPLTAPAAGGTIGRRGRLAEQHCCVPSGCSRYAWELIDPEDPGDAVKVVCSSPACVVGSWMHADCYEEWQRRVLFYIRSLPRSLLLIIKFD